MVKMFTRRCNPWLLALSCCLALPLLYPQPADAVTQYPERNERNQKFVMVRSELKASLTPAVRDKVERIAIPVDKLKLRVQKGGASSIIDPVGLMVPRDLAGITELARQLALPGNDRALAEMFATKVKHAATKTTDKNVKIDLDTRDLLMISPLQLGMMRAKIHHRVTVNSSRLDQTTEGKELTSQLTGYLSKDQWNKVTAKLQREEDLDVDTDLLPTFARRMVGKYVLVRGPNCFHAALAFQSPKFTHSPFIKVKLEEGYHRAMINYDVLWRIIGRAFYEVDTSKYPLKYGDLIVFFDVPKTRSASAPVNFHWIRHASTYLFGPYTFSKGSKFPDTPYSVKTLDEEWGVWRQISQNLGVKVYRRSQKIGSDRLPEDQIDWIY